MHVEDNSVESYELLSMPAFISLALYVLAGILAKASIALWFLTTARSRVQRILIIVPLGLYLLACSICFVLVLFRCGLPADPAIFFNVADCTIGPDVIYYSSWVVASLNSVCDWVFAAVPLYMVIKSQTMTQTARILASSLIGLAIVGSIVSVCRLPFLGAAKFGPHFLTSSVTAIAFMLSLIETAVAVTTISLATLQPLLAVLRRRWTVFRSRSVTRASSAGPMPPRCNNQPLPTDVVADMMRSGTVVKSTQRSTYDTKVRLDSEALGGIGILPDVSLHDSEDEDDNGLVQFLPRKRSIAMSVGVVTAMISIAEAADSPEISPDTEKDEYIGRM
ncbi:Hypothetical protein D9617_8g051800 [Elsinoe fawcettii]|nr:Hypothetical protein D9617_8g051800 [Elsinoe fawcettii]